MSCKDPKEQKPSSYTCQNAVTNDLIDGTEKVKDSITIRENIHTYIRSTVIC